MIAAGLEMAWEILENSPMMIERYRSATAAFGYSGDSMMNSMADGVTMTAGFLLALRLPWKIFGGPVHRGGAVHGLYGARQSHAQRADAGLAGGCHQALAIRRLTFTPLACRI